MLSATFVANEGCEDVILGQMLTVNAAPTATISGSGEICSGDSLLLSVELTGTAPWTIITSDEQNFVAETSPWSSYFTPAETMAYTVASVSDANGCSNTGEGEANVIVNPLPVVNLGDDFTMCHNHVMTLDAGSDGDTYNWSTGETTQTIEVDSTGIGYQGAKTISVQVTNSYACVAEDQIIITIEDCSGIEDLAEAIQLSLYPNPSNGEVLISFNAQKRDIYTLEVRDNRNALVKVIELGSVQGEFSRKLDLSTLVDGVYFVNIKTSDDSHLSKIIIQH